MKLREAEYHLSMTTATALSNPNLANIKFWKNVCFRIHSFSPVNLEAALIKTSNFKITKRAAKYIGSPFGYFEIVTCED